MKVIACIDNNNGIAFNNRRLSSDSTVIGRIAYIIGNDRLLAKDISLRILADANLDIHDVDNAEIRDNDWVFIDTEQYSFIKEDCSNIDTLVLFLWNRDYPSDTKLTLDLSKMNQYSQLEYKGNSHDKITELHFSRKESIENV